MTRVEQLLRKVRNRLKNKDNWMQGEPGYSFVKKGKGTNGPVCVSVAIKEAARSEKEADKALTVFVKANNIKPPKNPLYKTGIPEWNDRKRRTHNDVMKALTNAIDYACLTRI